MKQFILAIALLLCSCTEAKEPTKEYMAKKVGIWSPALAEPEAKDLTLDQFVQNAFRNVTSKSWEDKDDSWILIIKVKDPMTNKKSTIKFQFLKADKAAGPRRITIDGEDYPMGYASNFMNDLLSNAREKIGTK